MKTFLQNLFAGSDAPQRNAAAGEDPTGHNHHAASNRIKAGSPSGMGEPTLQQSVEDDVNGSDEDGYKQVQPQSAEEFSNHDSARVSKWQLIWQFLRANAYILPFSWALASDRWLITSWQFWVSIFSMEALHRLGGWWHDSDLEDETSDSRAMSVEEAKRYIEELLAKMSVPEPSASGDERHQLMMQLRTFLFETGDPFQTAEVMRRVRVVCDEFSKK
jgi:hypothetical protein